MRRKPVLFLLGFLAAIATDFVVERALLALDVAPRTAWIGGAVAFALVWAAAFWLTLHLPPRAQKGTSP
jgi:hypothetical protein